MQLLRILIHVFSIKLFVEAPLLAQKKKKKWINQNLVVDERCINWSGKRRLDGGSMYPLPGGVPEVLCWRWQGKGSECVSRLGLRSSWVTSCFSPCWQQLCSQAHNPSFTRRIGSFYMQKSARAPMSFYLKGERQMERQREREGPWKKTHRWVREAQNSGGTPAGFPGERVCLNIFIFNTHRSTIYAAAGMWNMNVICSKTVESHGSEWFTHISVSLPFCYSGHKTGEQQAVCTECLSRQLLWAYVNA